jgi:iodotyrosine deiodinase
MTKPTTKALEFHALTPVAMLDESRKFCEKICQRRTVRDFSDRAVDKEIILNAVRAAGSAPSGANKQPWFFAVVSNPEVKKQIRIAAEKEEQEFYQHRAPESWLADLEQFGTDENKPFLETAPYLIAVFLQKNSVDSAGERHKNYYMSESVGIATGILLTSLHLSGLVTLTHTPSPMGFLNDILRRPKNEKPFLLIVVGYPAERARVPAVERKSLDQIMSDLN